jgi:protein phosphatase
VAPLGQVLAGPHFDGETILTAEIDMGEIARGKYDLDVVGHYARPDVFQLRVNTRARIMVITAHELKDDPFPETCPRTKESAVADAASQITAVSHPTPPIEARPSRLVVRSFGITDQGRTRPSNEDQFLIAELARTLWVRQTSLPQAQTHHGRNRGYVFMVADGMGGHQAGEVASALSVATVEDFVLHLLRRFSNLQTTDEQTVLKDLQAAIMQADARIFEETSHHPEFTGMGTTLTMALVSGWNLFVIHAGDSRCYLFHSGQLRQLTADHTVAAEMARRGWIKPEDVRHHQYRHVVTNVLGGNELGVRVDVQRLDLQAGDVVLLCSDGLSDMLNDESLAGILAAEHEPEAACGRLVTEANAQGGKDNITAVVARFEAV